MWVDVDALAVARARLRHVRRKKILEGASPQQLRRPTEQHLALTVGDDDGAIAVDDDDRVGCGVDDALVELERVGRPCVILAELVHHRAYPAREPPWNRAVAPI